MYIRGNSLVNKFNVTKDERFLWKGENTVIGHTSTTIRKLLLSNHSFPRISSSPRPSSSSLGMSSGSTSLTTGEAVAFEVKMSINVDLRTLAMSLCIFGRALSASNTPMMESFNYTNKKWPKANPVKMSEHPSGTYWANLGICH